MKTPRGSSQAPQVRGVVFLAFLDAVRNLNLLAGEAVQRFIRGVRYNGWYPYAKQKQVFDLIEKAYPVAEPIMERIGIEFVNTIYGFTDWRPLFASGVGFLKTNRASRLYSTFVRGHPADIGHFTLVSLNESAGTAIIHSTTPFSKDLERGIILRGLQLAGNFAYVDVDNSQDAQTYHIEFFTATPSATASRSTITAEDFFAARRLTATRRLAGVELQKVFWRYKQLEKEL